MTHIFGKPSRKAAVKDAKSMQTMTMEMQKALGRTMYACEYLGKILDENGFRSAEVMSECQMILSGKRDQEIAESLKSKKDVGSNDEGIREPLAGALSAENGQREDGGDAEGICAPNLSEGINASSNDEGS